jgi:hypothetical protein
MAFVTIKTILPHENSSKPVLHSPASLTIEEERTKRAFTRFQEQTPVSGPVPRLACASYRIPVRVVRTPSPPQQVPLSTVSRSRSTPNYAIESLSGTPAEEVEHVQSKVNTIYQLQSTYPMSQSCEVSMETAMYALQWYDEQAYKYAVQKDRECYKPLPNYCRAYRITDSEERQNYEILLQCIEKQQQKSGVDTL